MQAGLYRLKRLGISRLTNPGSVSSAMNQLPDEAIALAAAAHIERELQITPWNLSSNFVACTNQVILSLPYNTCVLLMSLYAVYAQVNIVDHNHVSFTFFLL